MVQHGLAHRTHTSLQSVSTILAQTVYICVCRTAQEYGELKMISYLDSLSHITMMDLRLRGHSQCFLVNMLHLIQKHFGYIQLGLLVLQLKCGQNQAGSDLTSHIRFGSVL